MCHPSDGQVSCGACCGLFNLKLKPREYKDLLLERTLEFKSKVDYNTRYTVAAYRQNRESIEAKYKKQDEMTYNCPYLGYVDDSNSKIGCMIHPIFTGDPKSQNFSFYGTSICQGYDCKNKEHIASSLIESLILKVAKSSIEFSHLASDHILIFALEKWLSFKGWSISEGIEKMESLLIKILQLRLYVEDSFYPTSFEIRYEQFLDESDVYKLIEDYASMNAIEKEVDEVKRLGDEILTEMKNTPARI